MSALTTGRFRFAPILTSVVITVLLLMLFGRTAEVFLLLFVAILISLYLGALADFIHRRSGLPRRGALAISVLITLAGIVGLFGLLVPPVIEQTQGLVKVLPTYITNWEGGIERFIARFPAVRSMWEPGQHRVLGAVLEQVGHYFNNLLPKIAGLLHGFITIFSVAIMSLYLAMHPGVYREYVIALFPPVHRDLVRNVLGDLSRTLKAWIVGQLAAMVILGVLTAIGLYALGVPYWLTFGVFTGIAAIVPFFGSLVSTLLPALFVLGGAGGGTRAMLVVLLGVVIHIIEGNLVAPKIMEKQLSLPPVLTIMSVLIMGTLLGPPGLLVAVPTAAVLDVVMRRILINRIYEGQGFRRVTRDSALLVRVPAPDGAVLFPAPPVPDLVALAEAKGSRRVA